MMLYRNYFYYTYDFSKFKEDLDAVVKHYLYAQEQLYEMVSGKTNGAVTRLNADGLSQLQALFSIYLEVRKVRLFGSRI